MSSLPFFVETSGVSGLDLASLWLARSSASSSPTSESFGSVWLLFSLPTLPFQHSTFRYCCRGRSEKAETKNLRYALISEIIREGGLKMAIMVRYSAIPAHSMSQACEGSPRCVTDLAQIVSTAIFATAGMSVWTFLIAAFLALPKQLASVYLGSAENSGAPKDEHGST